MGTEHTASQGELVVLVSSSLGLGMLVCNPRCYDVADGQSNIRALESNARLLLSKQPEKKRPAGVQRAQCNREGGGRSSGVGAPRWLGPLVQVLEHTCAECGFPKNESNRSFPEDCGWIFQA